MEAIFSMGGQIERELEVEIRAIKYWKSAKCREIA